MVTSLLAIIFIGVSHFAMAVYGAETAATGMWQKNEMDPRVNTPIVKMFKVEAVNLLPGGAPNPGDPQCTAAASCTFDLFYTNGAQFNLNKPNRLNILFISGGPGQFINEGDGPGEDVDTTTNAPQGNMLLNSLAAGDDLNGRHNVVYFHVRGAGQSSSNFNRSNNYDKFLRARYVVEDIERLRKEVLKDKPWDAIYAHSWGTVVAQLYGSKFGHDPERKVRSLILSAPVARRDPNTFEARIKQTASNLEDIYRFFRPTGACVIDNVSANSYLKTRVFDFELFRDELARSDNLCFIVEPRVKEISEKVIQILNALEADYGSLSFVEDNFDDIKAELTGNVKFPIEFFSALRQLQFLGAPREEGILFTADTKAMIDASLLIGYYITLGINQSVVSNCDPAAKFFVGAAAVPAVKKEYCDRLVVAKESVLKSRGFESLRARHVFGAYDGVARWMFNMLNKKCFTGTDLMNFANAGTGTGDKKRFVRALVKRMGAPSKEEAPVCGWDPGGKNAHSIPTLILAGSTDAVIAGCQAEDFYNRGLKGPKVFLQFPGQGHGLSITNLQDDPENERFQQTKNLTNLLDKFIRMAISRPSEIGKFLNSVKSELKSVKAREHPKLENGSIACS
jgi:pimeloyl-ACP methyl ester carboxylesterase